MKHVGLMILAIGILCLTTTASAQSRGMGRVIGVVVDPSGAPIAEVTIQTATSAGAVIECTSDVSGKWTLAGIGKGEWLVSFQKPGFTTKRLKAVIEREIERSAPIKVTMTKS